MKRRMSRVAGIGGSAALSVLAAAMLFGLTSSARLTAGAGASDDDRGVIRVPADFASIQDAVDSAAPGDLIKVGPGTYCEHVVITKSDLRIQASGAQGAARTTLSGACSQVGGQGYGFVVQGTAAAPVTGVEISGFRVEHFETGFAFLYAMRSSLRGNEAQFNAAVDCAAVRSNTCSHGIILESSSFNEISENTAHDNGHLAVGLLNGSNGNLVRGNRLYNNQTDAPSCSIMLWGTPSFANQILENEVVDGSGTGIMIGSGSAANNNIVARNEVHGHAGPGIATMGPAGATEAYANVILQNDARGNGTNGINFDLEDRITLNNIWLRNLGTHDSRVPPQ